MTKEENLINSLANIHFKEAVKEATNNSLILLEDVKKQTFKPVKLDNVKLLNGYSLAEEFKKIEEEQVKTTNLIIKIIETMSNNQEAVNDAIDDLREAIEKGKIF